MAFDLTGYVLRSPRSAPSNAISTADGDSGVLRDIRDLPGSYALPGDLVEPYADMYRAAVLQHPVSGVQEYLIWAANSSNLSMVEDNAWAVTDEGVGVVPPGSISVTDTSDSSVKTDASTRLVITDNAGRSLSSIRKVTILRGDDPDNPIEAGPDAAEDFDSQDADAGLVTLSSTTLTALGDGVSVARGDAVSSVTYVLAGQRFWWTRNDQYATRFGWNGKAQRWGPFKGTAPVNIGTLLPDTNYLLVPRPSRFSVGDNLPGDPAAQDAYAMVRVGDDASASSLPVTVLVISDEDAEDTEYVFPVSNTPDAVLGVANGILRFHTDFLETHAGKTIWYLFEDFQETSTGSLGALKDAAGGLFLCPVPGPTDRPFISLGSRRYLTPVAVDTEADLPGSVSEGQVYWAKSTGRIKLSQTDIDKADPDAVGFDVLYLACEVVYDGVSLTTSSVPLPSPCQLTESDGSTVQTVDATSKFYLPEAQPLPFPGVSGALRVYDNSGTEPTTTSTWRSRAGGTGMVRSLEAPGDKVFFTREGAFHTTNIVEFEKGLGNSDSLPDFAFLIRRGRIWVALQSEDTGADIPRVAVGLKDRRQFSGESIYFRHAMVTPAVYAPEARIYSRVQEPFSLDGTEALAFRIDTTNVDWTSAGLVSVVGTAEEFTAAQVAADLQAAVTTAGGHATAVTASRGRVILQGASLTTGTVEIGFGSTTSGAPSDRDLSGSAALGFLPGWRVDPAGGETWLPDSGMSFGVYRSPLNRDRSKDKPDFRSRSRFSGEVLSKSVGASPYFFVDQAPLLDIPGYDSGMFFRLVDGINFKYLNHMTEVLYNFPNSRFGWLDSATVTSAVEHPTRHLAFGNQLVVGDSLHPAVISGGGLYSSEDGGPLTLLTQGVEYLLPDDGDPGIVHLIEVVGGEVASGSNGAAALPGAFTDSNVSDWAALGVLADYWLQVTSGDNQGTYVISGVSGGTLTVAAGVPFQAAASQVTWTVYKSYSREVYDPGVVADLVYQEFNHLSEEPFKVRLLHSVGAVPVNAAAQAAARLQAVLSEALSSGRIISLRFGQASTDPSATLTGLTQTRLGLVANDALAVPDLAEAHFVNDAFSIQVGSSVYTTGASNLVGVSSLTTDLSGDQIEYGVAGSPVEGQLNFGADTLTDHASDEVYYLQAFTDPTDLSAGVVEYDPLTGELNLSAADMASYAGVTAYFVEQLITEAGLDARISPMMGALYLPQALRDGQLVEVDYFQADSQGEKKLDDDGVPVQVTEKLPVYIRQEVATRVDETTYAFNSDGRTVAQAVLMRVWVGPELQNYGNTTSVVVNFDDDELHFAEAVDSSAVVTLNYAVYEAFGGEQTYTVSQRPVYRPPFFLAANTSSFTLETNRTAELVAGMTFRVGPVVFYIKSSSYSASTDKTTVTLYPTMQEEVGSRAPGHDAEAFLSSEAVATVVDGDATGARAGFLLTVTAEYEPVDRGMMRIVFQGDVRQYARTGHLLEIGGVPHHISGSLLSDDGRYTTIEVSSPFLAGYNYGQDAVKLSVRPIYPPGAREFDGVYPLLPFEDYELVLFGEVDGDGNPLPGRTLTETTEFSLDPTTGRVELLEPRQAALAAGQYLALRYTRVREIGPFFSGGVLIFPRFKASYAFVTIPDAANGYLGGVLQGTYTFRSPDTFYCRAVPLSTYMGEVAQAAASAASGSFPHSGPAVTSGASTDNWSYGTVGLLAERADLLDRDRAARTFISFYNSAVVAFEQIQETISGLVIGDRDGKFRFLVGRHKAYPPPGYEDEITGHLNPRLIWADLFEAASGSFRVVEGDPIVDPESATQTSDTKEVEGDPMDGFLVKFYIQTQRDYIQNDMDDRVLTGPGFPKMSISLPFFWIKGRYARMADPHHLSRLFPEAALVFTTLYPGMQANLATGDVGQYAFLKMLEPPSLFRGEPAVFGSTFRTTIGVMSNPAWGEFTQVTDCDARDRYPRARIWAFSATGFPDVDASFSSNPRPAVIATVLPLKDFPVGDDGWPDLTQLSANGGSLSDLSTGDAELHTPAFKAVDPDTRLYQQVAFGKPNGSIYEAGTGTVISSIPAALGDFEMNPRYKAVYIGEVISGCVLTFADDQGNLITDASELFQVGAGELESSTLSLSQGDTVFIVPPGGLDLETLELSDPPTRKELKEIEDQTNLYRRFQLGQKRRRGLFVDNTLPSIQDPSPLMLKEITGQKVPAPMTTIEADIEFANGRKKPFAFPALLGATTNDSGDYTIPYMGAANTELDRLGKAASTFRAVLGPDAVSGDRGVYPDEIVGSDGQLLAAASGAQPPATLLTSQDLSPTFVAHSGVGPVEEFDLLLVQSGQAVDDGMEGLLEIGAVSAGALEVPRFVSPTQVGSDIFYRVDHAVAYLAPTYGTAGVEITDDGTDVTLSIASLGGIYLNDGADDNQANGGWNNLVGYPAYPNTNSIILQIFDAAGDPLETVTITGSTVTGDGAGSPATLTSVPEFYGQSVILRGAAGAVLNIGGGTYRDFSLSIDATAGGSQTAYIGTDRLTFNERIDFRRALERGTETANAVSVECGLSVTQVTGEAALLTVNAPAEVNGGFAFTFLPRASGGGVSETFAAAGSSGAGDEEGSLKVMAFEAHSAALGDDSSLTPASSISFSAIPSSGENEAAAICTGTAVAGGPLNSLTGITDPTTAAGLSNIEIGDLCRITASGSGEAAATAGTYVIRGSVADSNPAAPTGYAEVSAKAAAPSSGAWLNVVFPVISSWDDGAGTITVDALQTTNEPANGIAWDASGGTLFVLVNVGNYSLTVQVTYTSLDVPSRTFTVNDATVLEADGVTAVSAATFWATLVAGQRVSGMVYLPMNDKIGSLLEANAVGYDSGTTTAAGLLHLTVYDPKEGGSETYSYTSGMTLQGTAGSLVVSERSTADPAIYTSSVATYFAGVPDYVDISGMTAAEWETIRGGASSAVKGITCPVVGDQFVLNSSADQTGTAGFRAAAGIFFEPSTPTPVQDLGDGLLKVVDASNSGTGLLVGMRDPSSFGGSATEAVTFEVRRIRRWHALTLDISSNLSPLRFAYEIREGTSWSYDAGTRVFTAAGGTQLGDFEDADVNVSVGDAVRVLDGEGVVLSQAEVAVIQSGTTLKLRPPGLSVASGARFQIYLKRAPVPHQQSNEELLSYITDAVLLDQTGDPLAGEGGRVETVNELKDGDSGLDYTTLGIQAGDILLVDPAGSLVGASGNPASPVEDGMRPFGDVSCPDRDVPGGPYEARGPSDLDDNRGHYWVTSVEPDKIVVSPAHTFAGDGSDVVFGGVGYEYVVLPTVNASTAPWAVGGRENQNDLRPTAPSDGGDSYAADNYSVEHFSYKIIRPSSLFSTETIDLILFMRERMLSWMEEMAVPMEGDASGSYLDFQSEEHITDIGPYPNGLGVPFNDLITDIEGLVLVSPYANTSDCLSVLGRRFWCLDLRLDYLTPPAYASFSDPYSDFQGDGEGRPVLPDRLDDPLDRTDRFRNLRYTWINYRSHRVTGTLPAVERFDESLEERLEEQENLLQIQESMEGT